MTDDAKRPAEVRGPEASTLDRAALHGFREIVALVFERDPEPPLDWRNRFGGTPPGALAGIDPVKLADGFGVEARRVEDEATAEDVISESLETVEREQRPFLLDVRMPQGLPDGGRPARPWQFGGGE